MQLTNNPTNYNKGDKIVVLGINEKPIEVTIMENWYVDDFENFIVACVALPTGEIGVIQVDYTLEKAIQIEIEIE
jgi:hypothetical protein